MSRVRAASAQEAALAEPVPEQVLHKQPPDPGQTPSWGAGVAGRPFPPDSRTSSISVTPNTVCQQARRVLQRRGSGFKVKAGQSKKPMVTRGRKKERQVTDT